jgi:hypothetical protein
MMRITQQVRLDRQVSIRRFALLDQQVRPDVGGS